MIVLLLCGTATAATRWTPRPTVRPWQIQLSGRIDTTVRAPVFEVDCDTTSRATVRTLGRRGARVLGYLDAGSTESYRADADRFPPEVVGKAYVGYPDERWLDIRRSDVLLPIMRDRMRRCARIGVDGVDPDNVDGYTNDTGFPLTADDQVRYDRALAAAAHGLGLAVTLKNAGELVQRLVRAFDGAVVEQCIARRECRLYSPFIARRKPVYAIEYASPTAHACTEARRRGFSLVFKRPALGAARRTCAQ